MSQPPPCPCDLTGSKPTDRGLAQSECQSAFAATRSRWEVWWPLTAGPAVLAHLPVESPPSATQRLCSPEQEAGGRGVSSCPPPRPASFAGCWARVRSAAEAPPLPGASGAGSPQVVFWPCASFPPSTGLALSPSVQAVSPLGPGPGHAWGAGHTMGHTWGLVTPPLATPGGLVTPWTTPGAWSHLHGPHLGGWSHLAATGTLLYLGRILRFLLPVTIG